MSYTHIKYREGYKYQLVEDYFIGIPITGISANEEFLILRNDGGLLIKEGYAWDGPSGPAVDTPSFMRGSLVHDALYQLMRHKYLNAKVHRKVADDLLFDICIEDGMSRVRAHWVYWGVRIGGKVAASKETPVKTAP